MAKFRLGKLVSTTGAMSLMKDTGTNFLELVGRHVNGDYGDLCEEDKAANDYAAEHNDGRILSSYQITPAQRIWVITESDRSSTCLLLPEEY